MKKIIKSLILVSLLMTSVQSQAGVIIGGAGGYLVAIVDNDGGSMQAWNDLATGIGVVGVLGGGALVYAGTKASKTWGKVVLIVLDEGVNAGFLKFIDENETLGQLESGMAREFLADTLISKLDETKTKQELKLTTDEMNSLLELEGIVSESQLGKNLAGALL